MRSSKKAHRRKAFFHAETVINARNKTISVVMTFMLVFTMLPISAFTYNGEALAESYSSFEESNSSTENSANTENSGRASSTELDASSGNDQPDDSNNSSNSNQPSQSNNEYSNSGLDNKDSSYQDLNSDTQDNLEDAKKTKESSPINSNETADQRDPFAWQSKLNVVI